MKVPEKVNQLWPSIAKEWSDAPARTLYYILITMGLIAAILLGVMKGVWEGRSVLIGSVIPIVLYGVLMWTYAVSTWRENSAFKIFVNTIGAMLFSLIMVVLAVLYLALRELRNELIVLIPDSSAKIDYIASHKDGAVQGWGAWAHTWQAGRLMLWCL